MSATLLVLNSVVGSRYLQLQFKVNLPFPANRFRDIREPGQIKGRDRINRFQGPLRG